MPGMTALSLRYLDAVKCRNCGGVYDGADTYDGLCRTCQARLFEPAPAMVPYLFHNPTLGLAAPFWKPGKDYERTERFFAPYWHVGRCAGCGEWESAPQEYGDFVGNDLYCDTCHEGKFCTCEDCGETIRRDEAEEHDGDMYCEDCYQGKFSTCSDCGEVFECEDMQAYEGNLYCEDCFNDAFIVCDHCGNVAPHDDCERVETRRDTLYFCSPYCAERAGYYRCEDCNEWSDDTIHIEGYGNICQPCYENGDYTTCDDCGEVYCTDDMQCIDDEWYCSSCADEKRTRYIKDYSYKPSPVFFPAFTPTKPYFGLELEVSADKVGISNDNKESAAQHVTEWGDGWLYCKYDGSVREGFEIVSHPAMFKEHLKRNYGDLFCNLTGRGFRSHDAGCSCGFHIHVSRAPYTEDELLNMAELVYKYADNFQKLGRRFNNGYAKFEFGESFMETLGKDAAKRHIKGSGDRYLALNFQNSQTVEYRFPKGTLKPSTFLATIELVDAICGFAGCMTAPKPEWSDFARYIHARQYSYLPQYAQARNVLLS